MGRCAVANLRLPWMAMEGNDVPPHRAPRLLVKVPCGRLRSLTSNGFRGDGSGCGAVLIRQCHALP